MTTQTTFEYSEGWAIDSVNEILGNLCCDLTYLDELAKVYQEEGSINGADLEEDHPKAYECWDNIQDYIYVVLLDHEVICEDFSDQFGREADDLLDYIDEQIEFVLEAHL